MKFTDGLWVVKEGYQLEYPKEISDISYSESGITLFAPYQAQEKTRSSIGCGLLTVQISAVGANAFSIRISNHKGSRKRMYRLRPSFRKHQCHRRKYVFRKDQ